MGRTSPPISSSTANPSPSAAASRPPTARPSFPPPAALWPRAANLAYDSTRAQVLLFGGFGATTNNDTWLWDGRQWLQKASATNPSARQGAAVTDDPDHHVVLLFGGDSDGRYRGDTWLWDGTTWHQEFPVHSPLPRTGAAVIHDPVHHVVLLFGGYANGVLDDTWTWDGSDWTQLTPATSPPARHYARLAFDVARGNAVLYGGFGGLDDTWTWDGTTWTQRYPTNTPPGINTATPYPEQMVYDAARRLIVFADQIQHSSSTADDTMDTWIWNGANWTRLAPAASPPVRDGYGLAYDASRSVTVYAGGWAAANADATSTWGWDGANWSRIG